MIPLTLTVWFLFLYGFWRIGDPFPLLSVSHGVFTIEQVGYWNMIIFKYQIPIINANGIISWLQSMINSRSNILAISCSWNHEMSFNFHDRWCKRMHAFFQSWKFVVNWSPFVGLCQIKCWSQCLYLTHTRIWTTTCES